MEEEYPFIFLSNGNEIYGQIEGEMSPNIKQVLKVECTDGPLNKISTPTNNQLRLSLMHMLICTENVIIIFLGLNKKDTILCT